MSWMHIAAVAFVAGTCLAGAAAFRRGGRFTGLSLALAAVFGGLLVTASRHERPTVVAIVLDQSPANPAVRAGLRQLVARARETGARQVSLVVIGGSGGSRHWVDPSAAGAADELADRPRFADDLPSAMAAAAAAVADGVREAGALGVLRGTAGRVIVGVTDADRWKQFQPAAVDEVLASARASEATVELIDLAPSPAVATVEIAAPLALPAGKPLAASGAQLLVTVRAPALRGRTAPSARVRVSGQLNAGEATLSEQSLTARVGAGGAVTFPLPLGAFRDPTEPGRAVGVAAGFVLVEVTATIEGTPPVTAAGSAYVAARRAEVWVACGPDAADGLLVPRRLDPAPLSKEPIPARLKKLAGPALSGPRLLPAVSCETFLDETTARDRLLAANAELPAVLVLHDVSPRFWTKPVVERLTNAVANGLHLLVVGPPVLPADPALKAAIERLLPAVAVPDRRLSGSVLPPRTVSREPVLAVAFDYGRVGAFAKEPAAADVTRPDTARELKDGLTMQLAAANRLRDRYKAKGLLHGGFERTGDEIAYKRDPKDRVVVLVAPKLTTADSLTAAIFPSAIELRVASLLHGDARSPLDWAKSGLPAGAGFLPGSPAETPNFAVVVFAADTPQPDAATAAGDPQPPIEYRIGGTAGVQKYEVNPDGALAVPLLSGATVAVVRLTAGDYARGLGELTKPAGWPGVGVTPFARFKITPVQLLSEKLDGELANLAGDRFPLTATQAKQRLIRGGADPFAATVDLLAGDALDQAGKAGERLADELLAIHASPRAGMSVTAVGYDRFVDERVPHGRTPAELTGPGADAKYPKESRWAAPRRYRALQLTAAYPPHARGTFAVGVEEGRPDARRPPVPFLVGGVAGNGAVAVLAYSPFETAESWWSVQDAVFKPGQPEPDAFGPQRVTDFANLTSRVRGPSAAPLVREVTRLDARGELEFVTEFVPAGTGLGDFWRPALARVDGNHGRAALDLVGVSWARGEARFRLRPADAAKLFAPNDQAIRAGLDFGDGRGLSAVLVVRKPAAGKWAGLTARESIATAVGFSGGSVGDPAALQTPTRSLRIVWLIALAVALTGVFAARSFWRWRHWLPPWRDRDAPPDPPLARDPDLVALGDRIGSIVDSARARPAPGEIEVVLPMAAGDPLAAADQQELLRLILGIPTLLNMTHRVRARSLRVLVLVNCGQSVRIGGRPGRPADKLLTAGIVAQLVCEVAWKIGAEVEVRAVGVAGDHCVRPAATRDGENGVRDRVREWGALRPTAAPTVAGLEPMQGAAVVYISDFLAEDVPELLATAGEWGDSGNRFSAALVHSPDDERQVGVGWIGTPRAVLDRTSATPGDLRDALGARRDEVRALFRAADAPLAVAASAMTGEELLAEVLDSGLVARFR